MPFTLSCPGCEARLKANEALVGKTIKCPRCTKPVLIRQPAPTAVAAMPRMELPPARIAPPPAPTDYEEEDDVEPAEPADELDELPEVDDEVEEAELDEAVAADDDDYADVSRRIRKNKKKRRPGAPTKDEKMMAMFIYLSALLLGFIFGPLAFVGPLVLWLMKRDESKFIDHHGKEMVNFMITMAIVGLCSSVVAVPVVFLTFGIGMFIITPLLMAVGVYALVMEILGAVKANNGEYYEFPISIRLIK